MLGSKEHIEKALRVRKLFGGAMRQVGYLAAAGIYALDNQVERLARSSKSKRNRSGFENCEYVTKVEPIETNIVIFNVEDSINPDDFMKKMADKGVLLISMGEGKIR